MSVLDASLAKDKKSDQSDPGLKCVAPISVGSLTYIFYLMLSGNIPKVWKSSLALPHHKDRDSNDLNPYRGISKLLRLAKILESLVNVQLCSFLSEKCILDVNQSEFRSGHSTITATSLVVNDLVNALDAKMNCAALFVDLRKLLILLIMLLSSIDLLGPVSFTIYT